MLFTLMVKGKNNLALGRRLLTFVARWLKNDHWCPAAGSGRWHWPWDYAGPMRWEVDQLWLVYPLDTSGGTLVENGGSAAKPRSIISASWPSLTDRAITMCFEEAALAQDPSHRDVGSD